MVNLTTGLSIIVPSLGDDLKISGLLSSIKNQDLDVDKYEVLVIVNGVPKANFDAIVSQNLQKREIKHLNFFYLAEANVNQARNLGVIQSKYDIVYLMDDDCRFISKSTLSFHIERHLQDNELFGLGGGYKLSADCNYWDELYNNIQMSWLLSGKITSSGNTEHLIGGNVSFKKNRAQKKSILFDPRISYGGSEHQFFVDALVNGEKLQLCNLDVVHQTNESFNSITRKIYKQGRGKAFIEQTRNLSLDARGQQLQERINFIQDDIDFELGQLKQSFYKKILNYIFWYGYYKEKRQVVKLPVKIVGDFFSYLNYLRFKIIDKFK